MDCCKTHETFSVVTSTDKKKNVSLAFLKGFKGLGKMEFVKKRKRKVTKLFFCLLNAPLYYVYKEEKVLSHFFRY